MKKYTSRKLKQLCSDDIIDILHNVRCEYKTYKETARKYRVTVKLVGRIVQSFKKDSEFISKYKEKAKIKSERKTKIIDAISLLTYNR